MPLLMLRDVPRYDCLLKAAERYPTLNPSASEAFLHLLRTGDAVFAAEGRFLAQHHISQGKKLFLVCNNAGARLGIGRIQKMGVHAGLGFYQA